MKLALRHDPFSMVNRFFNDPTVFDWDTASDNQMDVYEEGDNVIVKVKAPGFDDKSIDVSVKDGVITISGRREEKIEEKDDKKTFYRREIREESFSRSATLPANVQSDKAEASIKNGMVQVTLPKSEEAKPRKITVKSE